MLVKITTSRSDTADHTSLVASPSSHRRRSRGDDRDLAVIFSSLTRPKSRAHASAPLDCAHVDAARRLAEMVIDVFQPVECSRWRRRAGGPAGMGLAKKRSVSKDAVVLTCIRSRGGGRAPLPSACFV